MAHVHKYSFGVNSTKSWFSLHGRFVLKVSLAGAGFFTTYDESSSFVGVTQVQNWSYKPLGQSFTLDEKFSE